MILLDAILSMNVGSWEVEEEEVEVEGVQKREVGGGAAAPSYL